MVEVIYASSIVFIIFIIGILLIYYIFSRKNINQRKKHFEEVHLNLKPGVEIEFCGGLFGKVVKVNNERLKVKVADNVILEVSRYAVSRIIN
ncbi:MAG: preprotein translocase subunit YajC [Peptoniphilaceae bacterium]